MCNYFLLALFFVNKHTHNQQIPKWKYLLLAIFDLSGFLNQMYAFQMTRLASVTLMAVVAIIFAALLSMCLFKLRYLPIHYFAILVCIAGVITTIWSDLRD